MSYLRQATLVGSHAVNGGDGAYLNQTIIWVRSGGIGMIKVNVILTLDKARMWIWATDLILALPRRFCLRSMHRLLRHLLRHGSSPPAP